MRRKKLLVVALAAAVLTAAVAAAVVLATRGHSTEPHGLSKTKVARLHNGMSKREVRDLLGPADEIYYTPYPTPGELDEGFEECWDYGIKTLPRTPLYQLCFWNGRLTSQARYG